jgi:hypothetical protein
MAQFVTVNRWPTADLRHVDRGSTDTRINRGMHDRGAPQARPTGRILAGIDTGHRLRCPSGEELLSWRRAHDMSEWDATSYAGKDTILTVLRE